MNRRVLFVTPEIAPLNKVGGLGDVGHGLVPVLRREGWDVRVLLPAYPAVRDACSGVTPVSTIDDGLGAHGELLRARAAGLDAPLYLAHFPHHFPAAASPYGGWGEASVADARRFAAFAWTAVQISGGADPGWQPDVVHGNDWTTGLVFALLNGHADRPATVFTVHNLAHQGLFDPRVFGDLGLPEALWSLHTLEFHGRLSFIKGGLVFADRINTVSPSYACEILTPAFGCGLDGLLQHRQARLSGILNGIDTNVWDPARDPALPQAFHAGHPAGKRQCRTALQAELGLAADPDVAVIGMVSRLTHQKGIDLVVDEGPDILRDGVQVAVLGTGDPDLESRLRGLAAGHPGRCAVRVGYDEGLAHRIMAGADMLLMPSRFEPCGLTQLYALRYGTVPVAARTGGLADTIVHADEAAVAAGRATGVLFEPDNGQALLDAVRAALRHFRSGKWQHIQLAGMAADFGWPRSARQYGALYEQALYDRDTSTA